MKIIENIKPGEMEAEKMLRNSNIDTAGLYVIVRHTKDKDGERSAELKREFSFGTHKCRNMDCPLRDQFCNSMAFNLRNAENAIDRIIEIIKHEDIKRSPQDASLFIYVTENQGANLTYLFDYVGDTGMNTRQGTIYKKLLDTFYRSKFLSVFLAVWDCENNKYYVKHPTIYILYRQEEEPDEE